MVWINDSNMEIIYSINVTLVIFFTLYDLYLSSNTKAMSDLYRVEWKTDMYLQQFSGHPKSFTLKSR